MTKQVSRVSTSCAAPRSPPHRRIASGVSIIAQTRVRSGGAEPAQRMADRRERLGRRRPSGTRIASGAAAPRRARSSSPHGVSSALMRIDHFARAVAARLHGGADLLARRGLGVGRDRVLEVEDQRVGGKRLGLLERAGVGAGHVEHAAARADRVMAFSSRCGSVLVMVELEEQCHSRPKRSGEEGNPLCAERVDPASQSCGPPGMTGGVERMWVAGVDGCRIGWIAVLMRTRRSAVHRIVTAPSLPPSPMRRSGRP